MAIIEEQWASGQAQEDVAASDLTVDLDAEQTTCPACLGLVPGGSARCPSCGLRFT